MPDLIAVRGTTGDPYDRLLSADETAIDLVVIDGVPRYATEVLSRRLFGSGEKVTVAGEIRYLNLDDANADEIVAGLTLGAATTDAPRRNG